MYARGDEPGLMLWRLADARPAYVLPEAKEITDLSGDVVEQVEKDVKIKVAYDLAWKRAKEMKKAAESVGLEAAAKAEGKETFVTGLFSRKRFVYGAPVQWSSVPDVSLPTVSLREYFMGNVFSLAPKNVEPPYPEKPYALLDVPVPVTKEVFLFQRQDYRPLVQSEYEEGGRMVAMRYLSYAHSMQARALWFYLNDIVVRVGYEELP